MYYIAITNIWNLDESAWQTNTRSQHYKYKEDLLPTGYFSSDKLGPKSNSSQ